MNVAVIDTSDYTCDNHCGNFRKYVQCSLQQLPLPLYVVELKENARMSKYVEKLPTYFRFQSTHATNPSRFMEMLVDLRGPLILHVFSHGTLRYSDMFNCMQIRTSNRHLNILRVHLHLFGDQKIDLTYLHVFQDLIIYLYLNGDPVGTIHPKFSWDDVTLEYLLKDHSLKANVLYKLNYFPREVLRKNLFEVASKIFNYSQHSIEEFKGFNYSNEGFKEFNSSFEVFKKMNKFDDCAQYVRHVARTGNQWKNAQRKIWDLLKVLNHEHELTLGFWTGFQEPDLKCKCPQLCDQKCLVECIPLKEDCCLPYVPKHPFSILESHRLTNMVFESVEPDTLIMQSRAVQHRNYYLLHNDCIHPEDLIRHNFGVLSALFGNELPGNPMLWNMIFLYILAKKGYRDVSKERLYKEIRYLGQQQDGFLSLNPLHIPAIVAKLNTSFWYAAHISHRAFPNSRENLLRSFPFNAQIFVEFYREVYDPEYVEPRELPIWRLWRTLCLEKEAILPILAQYFCHENLNKRKGSKKGNPFGYVLYRQEKKRRNQPPASLGFLSKLDLDTVLRVYGTILEREQPSIYAEIEDLVKFERKEEEEGSEERKRLLQFKVEPKEPREPEHDTLDHVTIHMKSCKPLVTCPKTHSHWKDCAGEYDILKESNLQLFRNYCAKYREYPSGWKTLMIFLNEYVYRNQKKVPELFPMSTRKALEKVMKIFQGVMKTYSCEKYLECAAKHQSDEDRMKVEKRFAADSCSKMLKKKKSKISNKLSREKLLYKIKKCK